MLKKTYCFDYQSYFCHFGAKPSVQEYGTLEEAKHYQALNMRVNDDAYVGDIYIKKTVVYTKEDLDKQTKRKALKESKTLEDVWFDAIYTHWDGHKEGCRVNQQEKLVMFTDKTVYNLHLDLGESLKIFNKDHSSSTTLRCGWSSISFDDTVTRIIYVD